MSVIDTAINAAASALGFLAQNNQSQQGGTSRPAKGLAQITAFVNQVLAALDLLKTQVSQLTPSQRSSAANRIVSDANNLVAALSDPNQVYQAKRGDDAAALQRGKDQAQGKVNEIQQLLSGGGTGSGGGGNTQIIDNNSNNNTSTALEPSRAGNEMDKYLLLGGGFLLAYLLIKRK